MEAWSAKIWTVGIFVAISELGLLSVVEMSISGRTRGGWMKCVSIDYRGWKLVVNRLV
jgi:hypothetical protein